MIDEEVAALTLPCRVAGNEYLTGLTLYFIGYVLFEVRRDSPRKNQLETSLMIRGPLQYRSEIDIAKVMASDSYTCLGHRRHSARGHAEQGRLLRCSFLSRCDRKRSFSRRGILPFDVV